jgi:hypothetical protein
VEADGPAAVVIVLVAGGETRLAVSVVEAARGTPKAGAKVGPSLTPHMDEVVQPFGGSTATAATLDHRHSTWTLR